VFKRLSHEDRKEDHEKQSVGRACPCCSPQGPFVTGMRVAKEVEDAGRAAGRAKGARAEARQLSVGAGATCHARCCFVGSSRFMGEVM
jgi:hypothetical protein